MLTLDLDLAFAARGTSPRIEVEQRFPEPTADPEAIERLLFARLEREPPPAAVAAAGPGVAGHDRGRRPATAVVRAPGRAHGPARLAARAAGPDLRGGSRPAGRHHGSGGATPRDPLGVAAGRAGRGVAVVTRLLREHPTIDVEFDADGRLVAIRWNGRREVGRGLQSMARRGVVVARADRARLPQGRRRAMARARLPGPDRRDVAPGAPVRLNVSARARCGRGACPGTCESCREGGRAPARNQGRIQARSVVASPLILAALSGSAHPSSGSRRTG